MIARLLRLFRPRLFDRGAAAHRDGWSMARQLWASGYVPDDRYSPEGVAASDAEMDKRARRIAVAESRRRREAKVTDIRRRIS